MAAAWLPTQPGQQRLQGARVVVTGGSKGIGKEIVRGLLKEGAHVTIAARDVAACQAAKDELETAAPVGGPGTGTLHVAKLDLEDPSSIRQFAAEQKADKQPIKLLVNNAGVMGVGYANPPSPTPSATSPKDDVMDRHILVNHLGPFLLTQLLSDQLTQGSRVVTISSRAHRAGSLAFEEGTGRLVQRPNVPWFKRYGDSKLANVLFTAELQRRLGPRGITAVSVSPGLVSTSLFTNLPWPLNHLSTTFFPWVAQTPAQGARTALYACLSPEVTGTPEQVFLHACKPQEPSAAGRDSKLATQLWEWSERFWATDGSSGAAK